MSESNRIVENVDARAWDDFVAAHPHGHLLQSSAWGELKTRFGWSAQRTALERGGALIAGAQILFRRLPLGWVYAYVPRGPVADFDDHHIINALFDALFAAAKSRGAFVLKLEPNVLNFEPSTLNLQPSTTIQPRTTIHVDLTRDLDAILAQMKQKWRYNIRLAERKGVIVRAGSADDIATFYRLLQITSKRDRFAIHSFEYYRAAFDLLTARDAARLFIAEYAREPLAAILVTAFGEEAIYLYGASSDAHRARMPNYALHWAAMQWAKARECARYDLWGIADVAWAEVDTVVGAKHSQDRDDKEGALPDRTGRQSGHGLADASPLPHGLYRFKQGFGGAVVRYAGAYDAVFSRARYWLYTRALALRRGAMT